MIYVWDDMAEAMVPRDEYLARKANQSKRGDFACPMLSLDTMEPVQSQLDGKLYDSKAALRRTYKEHGVIEVGNDSSVLEPKPREVPRPDRNKIREAVGKAVSRVNLTS